MSSSQPEESQSISQQHEAPQPQQEPPLKRQRTNHGDTTKNVSDSSMSLPLLCIRKMWGEARLRALQHPEEASLTDTDTLQHSGQTQPMRRLSVASTPLALACRQGAPFETVKAILQASPSELRRLISSYGTPLHEAIVCDDVDVRVIELLLETDEQLGGPLSSRAALLQDVDGHTPLHLLIRRKFQSCSPNMMTILSALVRSCPSAIEIPDCGEYEEPPLVMALKASVYSYSDSPDSSNNDYETTEKRIHEMVKIMLQTNPDASGKILTGARGQYTALHSAVFHGRCSQVIGLLLKASDASKEALLLSNTQGELPLHFCAMRGEPPESIELLSRAAPSATLKRDASGLTPMHWLWIRFVSALLSLEDAARNNSSTSETTVELPLSTCFSQRDDPYSSWSKLEQGEFYSDLRTIRKLDPPVDFLRMRHIPPELMSEDRNGGQEWADRTARVLRRVRGRYYQTLEGSEQRTAQVAAADNGQDDPHVAWTRQEAVSALFWSKVVSLLRAANSTTGEERFLVTHAAMRTFSCPPSVVRVVTALYPEELRMVDSSGRLPLHHAASYHEDCKRQQEELGTTQVSFLKRESLQVFQHCMDVSSPRAARVADNENRLVLHHAIDTFVKACCRRSCQYWYAQDVGAESRNPVENMLAVLKELLKMYPDSLERRDGKSMLYPFLQATAANTEYKRPASPNGYPCDEAPLSIVYLLLRENPSLVKHH